MIGRFLACKEKLCKKINNLIGESFMKYQLFMFKGSKIWNNWFLEFKIQKYEFLNPKLQKIVPGSFIFKPLRYLPPNIAKGGGMLFLTSLPLPFPTVDPSMGSSLEGSSIFDLNSWYWFWNWDCHRFLSSSSSRSGKSFDRTMHLSPTWK